MSDEAMLSSMDQGSDEEASHAPKSRNLSPGMSSGPYADLGAQIGAHMWKSAG